MIHYWVEEEKRVLKDAKSFHELLDIALAVTARMPKPTAQVCGPISTGGAGNREANCRRFQIAIDVLSENGWNVFDQMIFQDAMMKCGPHMKDGKYNTDILDIFYHGIFSSGHINTAIFLPGWETSHGAQWERKLISTLPIEIMEYPENLFEEVLRREKIGE